MAFTIASSVSATASSAAPTGRSTQGHLIYAVNQAAYWIFWLDSTQNLKASYSTNSGTSWNTPTGSPFGLTKVHNGEGRDFGFCYANISSTDVLHMASSYLAASVGSSYHSRFTLGSTWTNTNGEAQVDTNSPANLGSTVSGTVPGLDSTSLPINLSSYNTVGGGGNFTAARASNTDAGSSWTAGFGASALIWTATNVCQSFFITSLGSSLLLAIADNASTTTTFTNHRWSRWNGSWSAIADVFGSTVTATDFESWGAVAVSSSDVHDISLANNSNTYNHSQFNGSSWSSGSAIGNLTYGTAAGISLVSDGTALWAATFDSSKNLQYNKWTSAGGWGGWSVLEATRANTPSYITGVYNSTLQEIMFAWSEVNGSNFDIIGTKFSAAADPIGVASNTFSACISQP